jgi:hypothetical protein
MSEPRVINRNYFFTAIGLLVLAIIALGFFAYRLLNFAPSPSGNNPPVVVRGGSIHGIPPTTSLSWEEDSQYIEYHITSPNSTLIYTVGVLDGNSHPISSPITATQGWVINFYDQGQGEKQTTYATPGVSLCSDESCSSNRPGDKKHVYLQVTRNNTKLELTNAGEIHFHNDELGCDTYPPAPKEVCDHIDHLGIKQGNASEVLYKCDDGTGPGYCSFYIGGPPPAVGTKASN